MENIFKLFKKKTKLNDFLEKEQRPYSKMFDVHPDAIYLIDYKGNFIEVNSGFAEMTGYTQEEVIGKSFYPLIFKEDLEEIKEKFSNCLTGINQSAEYRLIHKNGNIRNKSIDLAPLHGDDGEIIGVFGIGKDITQEKELQLQVKQQEGRFHSLVKNSSDIITILDKNKEVVYRSPSFKNVLGYAPEAMPAHISHITHPDDLEEARRKTVELYRNTNRLEKHEIRFKHKNGEWRNFSVIATNLLHDPDVEGIVLNYRDITELKKAQQEVHYMAFHDFLTDLPNRRFLDDRLHMELKFAKANKTKLAVMFIDLDNFKFINDTLGHDIGDKVIQEVARKLNQYVSANDFVARWAGDEFIILVSNKQYEDSVKDIAETIKKSFETPFEIEDYEIFVTASMGISIYPDSGEDSQTLIKNADFAMYLTKQNGKNDYQVFTPTMNIRTYKTFTLQNDIRTALKENQFELYYQPKVNSKTKKIVGAEALIRWNHPEWGVISPGEFIYLAEESGLINPIGDWVLRTVCSQIKLWKEAGFEPIKVSLNMSVYQFLQKNFIEKISNIINENEIEGKWLEFEVTESILLEKEVEMERKINALTKLGVDIALDDFGTGYSSLGYLRKYKFRTIKLDRSFITDIHTNQESQAIIKFIINLAKELKMNVVAEGVEFEQQLNILSQLECDEIQGYLFSKPLPVKDFENLLGNNKIKKNKTTEHGKQDSDYFKVLLKYPIESAMTIVELNKKKIQVGKSNVLVEVIGPGGLQFLSDITLPNNVDLILQFTTQILGQEIIFKGKIVWSEENDVFSRYGIEFVINEEQIGPIIKLLNQLQIKMKNNSEIESTPFITKNKTDYFLTKS